MAMLRNAVIGLFRMLRRKLTCPLEKPVIEYSNSACTSHDVVAK